MKRAEARDVETKVPFHTAVAGASRHKSSGVFVRATAPRRVAALDLRSNSVHLVVADVTDGAFTLVAQAKEKIQLGETVFADGCLSEPTMSRGLDALRRLLALADRALANEIVAVASPAFRQAANGQAFVRRVEAELGLSVRMLDGAEQARLLLSGVRASLALETTRFVVVDLGGGSAEVVLAEGPRTLLAASLPVGTLRLRAALGGRSLPDARGIAEVERYASRYLAPIAWRIRQEGLGSVVLSCGVARRLWRLAEPTRKRGASLPPRGEARLSAADLDRLLFRLKGMTEKGRTFAIGAVGGADTLLTGAIVLRTLVRLLGVTEVTVCTTGMREGIIVEAGREAGPPGLAATP